MTDKDTKETITADGTRIGETTTDVVSKGGVKIGDIVFAVHERDAMDKPLSDIRKAPAIVTAVDGESDDKEGTKVNVTVFHDSHENTWFEGVTLYDKDAKDAEESNRRFKNGIYVTKKL